MSNTLASLEVARDKARQVAAQHPNQAKVEVLRERSVTLHRVIKSGDRSSEQKTAAAAELATISAERATLQAAQRSDLQAAQDRLTAGRRAARADADAAAAAKLANVPTEELEARRAALTAARKAGKREMRAVVLQLGKRQAELRVKELLATLSDADRRALQQQLQTEGVATAEVVGVPGAS